MLTMNSESATGQAVKRARVEDKDESVGFTDKMQQNLLVAVDDLVAEITNAKGLSKGATTHLIEKVHIVREIALQATNEALLSKGKQVEREDILKVLASFTNDAAVCKKAATDTSQNSKSTYAEVAATASTDANWQIAGKRKNRAIKNVVEDKKTKKSRPKKPKIMAVNSKIITIVPTVESGITSCEGVKRKLRTLINPQTDLKVKNIRDMRNKGVLIEVDSETDLSVFTSNQDLEKAGLKASIPTKRLPKVIVYDVSSDMSADDVKEALIKQNLQEEEIGTDEIQFKFKTGPKDLECVNWVLEVSPKVRTLLLRKGKLFIQWSVCRLRDFTIPSRCYKCQKYGHISKSCNANKVVCAHCGTEGHDIKACPSKQVPGICANCKSAKRPHLHAVSSRNCPSFASAVKFNKNNTDYGN